MLRFPVCLLCLLFPIGEEGKKQNPPNSKQELPSLKDNEVPEELAKAIDQAVDKGVAWLLTQQTEEGSFRHAAVKEQLFAEFPLGSTDLAILALLSSGIPREQGCVQHALRYVLDHPSRTTYEAGLTLMALDMKGSPSWERKSLAKMSAEQRKHYFFPRLLTPEEKTRIEEDAAFLIKSWGQGYWSYEMKSGEDGDISNTQFALLGLKAASRCGVQVSEAIFERVLQVILNHQSVWGKKVSYPKILSDASKGTYIVDLSANARGWAYFYKPYRTENDVTGSRTNIGLACIALCEDELMSKGSDEVKARLKMMDAQIQLAVTDGLAWLNTNFSVERNPGTENFNRRMLMPVNGYWYYYYMYSLERTGVLLATRCVGRHDWYVEGAEALLKRQKKDGSWEEVNPLVDTTFALLFLRRATTPSIYSAAR